MASWRAEIKDYEFDSRIDTPAGSLHFTLTLILRLFLRALNPPKGRKQAMVSDSSNNKVPTLRWDRASWIHFKAQFRLQSYMTWDRAFLLTPSKNYDGFVWPDSKGTRRSVLCLIEVDVVDREEGAHAPISVVRLSNPGQPSAFRSDDFNLDSNDVDPIPIHGFGFTWTHHAIPHEIGHLLGLHHINEKSKECRDKPAGSVCYGADLQQSLNVMGRGDSLDLEDASPWRDRIARHT